MPAKIDRRLSYQRWALLHEVLKWGPVTLSGHFNWEQATTASISASDNLSRKEDAKLYNLGSFARCGFDASFLVD